MNKKVISVLLTVVMLICIFTGCIKTTGMTKDKFVKACEKLKLTELEIDEMDEIEEKIKARAAETDIVPEETYSLDDDDDPTGEIGGDGIGEEGFDLRVLGVDADE